MSNSSINDKLDYYLQKYVSGEMTDEEARSFLSFLDEHADSCGDDEIYDNLRLHYLLEKSALAGERKEPAASTRGWRGIIRGKSIKLVLFSAVSICCLIAVSLYLVSLSKQPTVIRLNIVTSDAISRVEDTSCSVAFVKAMSNVVWSEDNEADVQTGHLLSPGWLRLKSGIVAVQFFSGANVVLEGPAEFQIISTNRAYCSSGKLTAEVPTQAAGFRVDVPHIDVVDLGTAFTLDVTPEETVVNVIQGEVELYRMEQKQVSLKSGENAVVKEQGKINPGKNERLTYTPLDEMTRIATSDKKRKYNAWKDQGDRLNRDPSLLVRFDFERDQMSTSSVSNTSDVGRNTIHNGLMIGCEPCRGMWGDKGGIEIRRIVDRLRFDVSDEFESVTLALWVRIDSIERLYSSLFTTDGFGPGELHWYVLSNGKIELEINDSPTDQGIRFSSKPVISPEMIGEWIHLAFSVDVEKQKTVLYMNGRAIAESALNRTSPVRFTVGQLGNWTIDPRQKKGVTLKLRKPGKGGRN